MVGLIFLLNFITTQNGENLVEIWRDASKNLILFKENTRNKFRFIKVVVQMQLNDINDISLVKKLTTQFKESLQYEEILKDLKNFAICTEIIDELTNTKISTQIKNICDEMNENQVKKLTDFFKSYLTFQEKNVQMDNAELIGTLNNFCVRLITYFDNLDELFFRTRKIVSDIIYDKNLQPIYSCNFHDYLNTEVLEDYKKIENLILEQRSIIFKLKFNTSKETIDAQNKLIELEKMLNSELILKYKEYNYYLSMFSFTNDYITKKILILVEEHKEILGKIKLKIYNIIFEGYVEEKTHESSNTIDCDLNILNLIIYIINVYLGEEILDEKVMQHEKYDIYFCLWFILYPSAYENEIKEKEEKLAKLTLAIEILNQIMFNIQNKNYDDVLHKILRDLNLLNITKLNAYEAKIYENQIKDLYIYIIKVKISHSKLSQNILDAKEKLNLIIFSQDIFLVIAVILIVILVILKLFFNK